MELIDPIKWKHDDMFTFDSKSQTIFAKYKATDYLDRTVETLTNDKFIRKQLEHQQINVNTITNRLLAEGEKRSFHRTIDLPLGNELRLMIIFLLSSIISYAKMFLLQRPKEDSVS